MNTNIKAVKFELREEDREYLNKKLERIKYAEEHIIDTLITIKLDKKYYFECTINFRWGGNAHVSCDDYDYEAGVNKMMDIIDQKVKKEKDKIQNK